MLLDENPFHLLGASTRSDRRRIVALVEEKSLFQDPDLCSGCCNELISLRSRLLCEVAWLPGVSAERAEGLLGNLANADPVERLPSPLAQLNATMSRAARLSSHAPEEFADVLLNVARECEAINAEEVRLLINEDRRIAGFALVDDASDVTHAVALHLDDIGAELVKMLRARPLDEWVQVLTAALDRDTRTGTLPGSRLLHVIADALAVDLDAPLEREKLRVDAAIKLVRFNAQARNIPALERAIATLELTLTKWDRYAQPLQISAKSRGTQHGPSNALAMEVRNLSIALHNEHDAVGWTERITELLGRVFAEDPRVVEIVGNDRKRLVELAAERKGAPVQQGFLEALQPITSPPGLRTFNSIGTKLYGHRDEDPRNGSYIATVYFVILYLPLFPLSSYRVRNAEKGGWYFLGKVPISLGARRHRALAVVAAALVVVMLAVNSSQTGSTVDYSPSALAQPVTSQPSFSRVSLSSWLESERAQIKQTEAALSVQEAHVQSLNSELERDKTLLGTYDASAVDGNLPSDVYSQYEIDLQRYNREVVEYNSALQRFKLDYADYQLQLAAFNDSVDRYNSAP